MIALSSPCKALQSPNRFGSCWECSPLLLTHFHSRCSILPFKCTCISYVFSNARLQSKRLCVCAAYLLFVCVCECVCVLHICCLLACWVRKKRRGGKMTAPLSILICCSWMCCIRLTGFVVVRISYCDALLLACADVCCLAPPMLASSSSE